MNKLKHLAIVMDGNGRWAQQQNLKRSAGHEKGSIVLLDCAKWAKKHGIEEITYYAFSTENWKRSEKEINFLFKLPIMFFDKYFSQFIEEGIKVNISGNRAPLPAKLNKKLDEVIELTKNNHEIVVNIALNYGGRDEIVNACKNICNLVHENKILIEDINESVFNNSLYVKNDVDLLIRTGGEFRVSNFLLWQIAYSEIYILDKYWPDFNENDLSKAMHWYNNRDRRFGGINNES